jgi:hypothetical protein
MYTAVELKKIFGRPFHKNASARKIGSAYHLSDGTVVVLPGHGDKKWVTL